MRPLAAVTIIAGVLASLWRGIQLDWIGVLFALVLAGVVWLASSKTKPNVKSDAVNYYAVLSILLLGYIGTGGNAYDSGATPCGQTSLCYGLVASSGKCVGVTHTATFTGFTDCSEIAFRIPRGGAFCSKNTENISTLTVLLMNDGTVPLSQDLFLNVSVDGTLLTEDELGQVLDSGKAMRVLDSYNCGGACSRGLHNLSILSKTYKQLGSSISCPF